MGSDGGVGGVGPRCQSGWGVNWGVGMVGPTRISLGRCEGEE